jgi:positive regulator of sigma E activity
MNLSVKETARLQVIEVTEEHFFAQPIPDNGCTTGHCGAGGLGCQTNAFARLLFPQSPRLKFSIPAHMKIKQGDEVLVDMAQDRLLWMSLSVYGGSLLTLIAGIALGQYWWGDWGGLTLGILALLSSWHILNRYFVRFSPEIIDIKSSSCGV